MTNEKSAVALIAGLVIGAGFGFTGAMLLGSADRNEAPTAATRSARVSHVPATAAVDRRPTQRIAVAEQHPATPVAAHIPTAEIESVVAAAEAAAQPAPPAAGGGQIEGAVRSVDGQPIAGVLLIASQRSRSTKLYGRDPDEVGRSNPAERSLRESLESSASSWAKSRGRKYRVRADREGRFQLSGLPMANYSLRGYAEGWVFESSPSGYVPATGTVVYLTGTRVREVDIDVRLPDGTQPEIAAVRAEIGDDTSTLEWRPDRPTVRLREGSGTLQARAGIVALGSGGTSPPAMQSDTQSCDADIRQVTLQLQPNTGLWGELRDTWGANRGYQVRLIELGASRSLQDGLFDNPARSTSTRRATYHFDDLEPGTYGVAAMSRNRTVLHSQVVTVGDALTRHDLEIGEPDPANYIRATCIGPQGHMLSGVDFDYRYRSNDSSSSGSPSVKRSPEGAYWLAPRSMIPRDAKVDFDALPADHTLELTAKHSRFGKKTVRLVPAQRSLEIRFAAPCQLEVQILGYETSPIRAKLRIGVRQKKSGSDDHHRYGYFGGSRSDQAKLTSTGRAVYDTLAPGTWVVSLLAQHATEWGSGQGAIAQLEVELGSGTRRVDLPIPALHDLEVHAPDLDPGARLMLQRVTDGSQHAVSMSRSGRLGPDRRIRWSNLPAGAYRVHGGRIAVPIDAQVPGPSVLFKGAPNDCWQVAISSQNGSLYQAGFRAGDMIVAIDGAELNPSNLYEMRRAPGKKPIAVLRDGQRHELELDMSDVWQRQSELGGTLVPAVRAQN
ncbi:MAG: hypothetical protein AAF628_33235 [Planctomycetota bacterium]